MVFAAWTWPWVLGTLAAASALVVVIHLLRLRRRKLEVPFLPLFEEALGDASAAKKVDWLRRLLALLLSLAIVASLALSLGDPRFGTDDDGRAVIVLVDASLSMEARAGDTTRLEEARDAARRLVRSLGRHDEAAIVAVGEAPLPLTPLTPDVETLDHAIASIPRGRGAADFDAALSLAFDMLAGRSKGEIVVVSDFSRIDVAARTIPDHIRLYGLPVGGASENLAIEAFATRRLPRDPSRASVLLRVQNHGALTRKARLELRARDVLVEAHDLSLEPGEARTLDVADVPALEDRLEARLVPVDAIPEGLAEDDVAFASIAPRRPLRVHVVSPGNLFLEAALLLDPTLALSDARPGDPLPEGPVDLFVFDRALPEARVAAPAIYIAPPDDPAGVLPVALGPKLKAPYFEETKREDPLVAGLRLYDVNILEGRSLVLEKGDVGLGQFGKHTLLARGVRDGVPFLVMGFAIQESDLPLRIAFPLLLLRSVDALTRRDAVLRLPHRVGEPVEITLASSAGEATWTTPSGATRALPLDGDRARLVPLEPGVHLVEAGAERTELVVERVAAAESDLTPPEELRLAGVELEAPPDRVGEPLRRPMLALLALAALLLLLEHLFYHRRWIE